ncbi:helix-turn-helix domain-containing protein [Halorientalis pallida]|uniref:Bacterio-opsin activator n=1 Tax=Halorientalis pallida TaxID=2479928 RepID=A0A498KZ90_9EURY|nr:helix-turn-helix domain-containing protein [Halorientalis pallida]RXK51389.1 bacterio-opsin activator [Halorientalis pallida]
MSTTEPDPIQAGVSVTLAITRPRECPLADASSRSGARVDSVARTSCGSQNSTSTEFTVQTDSTTDGVDGDPVFRTDEGVRYRRQCEAETCPADLVESFCCPVNDVHAVDGTLYVVFYAPDTDQVRDIVAAARERFDDVAVRNLSQSGEVVGNGFVSVDTGRLTDRQREVLTTAYDMGYFEYPKGANAEEVAAELEISPSTLAEHLAAAQQKVLGPVASQD